MVIDWRWSWSFRVWEGGEEFLRKFALSGVKWAVADPFKIIIKRLLKRLNLFGCHSNFGGKGVINS